MARTGQRSDMPSGDETPPDTPSTTGELEEMRARIAELEADNQRLAEQTSDTGQADSAAQSGADAPATDASTSRSPSQRWRAPLSALCVVIAAILVPVSIVASWARAELVDQNAFVQTFAPLADDPAVQALIIDQTVNAIDESIDINGLTADLFDGIAALGLPPRAGAALDLLRGPAAAGVQSILTNAITTAVESDAFASVWERALRLSHTALLATVNNDGTGAVAISNTGEVGIQLGPIVADLRQRLIDQGFGFASVIPVVSKTIVVAQSDALVVVNTVYALAVAVGWWVPLLCLGFFVLGLAIARKRSIALIGSGIGIALGSATLAIALAVGGTVLAVSAGSVAVTSAAITAIFNQVIGAMRDTSIVLLVLGILLALFAWLSSGSRTGRRVQGVIGSINSSARIGLAARGADTGAVGTWLYRQRVLVRVILLAAGVVWLLALRPLSTGDVFLVVLVGIAVWWLTELAQRRPGEIATAAADAADAASAADAAAAATEAADAAEANVATDAETAEPAHTTTN